ncbi:MAG: tRNA lysidine(34) synthetase TilS [Pyrinomonadaceae bacterium]|nr:tRNA lysidine(34) synthetase TilS [Pyrinomonadaceae bacterium]
MSEMRTRVSEFARRLSVEWWRRDWPSAAERIVVGVSGGGDSMALLLALDELLKARRFTLKIVVAHLDHGLRGRSGAVDAEWVAGVARELGHEVVLGSVPVKERAAFARDNIEQAARRARYEFFTATAKEYGARLVATAHTLDDQAETVLLRLMRGSGADGLGGMRPARPLDAGGDIPSGRPFEASRDVQLVRPLLCWARRVQTVDYCRERGVQFRTDAMNDDERYARVRVRHNLLPLMEAFNPQVVEALARTAELLQDDAAALDGLAARLLNEARDATATAGVGGLMTPEAMSAAQPAAPPLRVGVLAAAAVAVRRRALRQWLGRGRGDLRRIEMGHVLAVERLLAGGRGGRIAELPGGTSVERRRAWIHFCLKKS